MLGSLRCSRVQRVVEIAQATLRPVLEARTRAGTVSLPLAGSEEVESTVALLSHFRWGQRLRERVLCSVCTALRKDAAYTVNSINSLWQCIFDESEGRDLLSSHATSFCCTALLSTIAENPALYSTGRSLMHQLLLSFPECLLESLAQDTVSVFTGDAMGLVQLIRKARQMDRKPPLGVYGGALRMLQQAGAELPAVREASEEVTVHMSEDWGKERAQETLLSTALQLSRNTSQVEDIWKRFSDCGIQLNEKSSLVFLEACLRSRVSQQDGAAESITERVDINTMRQRRKSATFAMSALTRKLPSSGAAVTVGMFDAILHACEACCQPEMALAALQCSIDQYHIAPSRQGYRSLMMIFCNPWISTWNHHHALSQMYVILADTTVAYDNEPPPWVYVETARPLVLLMGMEGYRIMLNMSTTALESKGYGVEDLPLLWNQPAFTNLLNACTAAMKRETAQSLLWEMLRMGHQPDQRPLMPMLSFIRGERDLAYFNYLLFLMQHLSVEQALPLERALAGALERVIASAKGIPREDVPAEVVSTAAREILLSLPFAHHEHCITQLSHCRGGHAPSSPSPSLHEEEVEAVQQQLAQATL